MFIISSLTESGGIIVDGPEIPTAEMYLFTLLSVRNVKYKNQELKQLYDFTMLCFLQFKKISRLKLLQFFFFSCAHSLLSQFNQLLFIIMSIQKNVRVKLNLINVVQ